MYDIPRNPLALVQYAFRALGRKRIPRDQLCLFLSFQLRQMPPSKAQQLVDDLVSKGELAAEHGMITLLSDGDAFAEEQKESQSTPGLGDLLRSFASASRLSSAVAIADGALEIRRI